MFPRKCIYQTTNGLTAGSFSTPLALLKITIVEKSFGVCRLSSDIGETFSNRPLCLKIKSK